MDDGERQRVLLVGAGILGAGVLGLLVAALSGQGRPSPATGTVRGPNPSPPGDQPTAPAPKPEPVQPGPTPQPPLPPPPPVGSVYVDWAGSACAGEFAGGLVCNPAFMIQTERLADLGVGRIGLDADSPTVTLGGNFYLTHCGQLDGVTLFVQAFEHDTGQPIGRSEQRFTFETDCVYREYALPWAVIFNWPKLDIPPVVDLSVDLRTGPGAEIPLMDAEQLDAYRVWGFALASIGSIEAVPNVLPLLPPLPIFPLVPFPLPVL